MMGWNHLTVINAMVTHRVRITDKNQVNAELIKWLKQAYETA